MENEEINFINDSERTTSVKKSFGKKTLLIIIIIVLIIVIGGIILLFVLTNKDEEEKDNYPIDQCIGLINSVFKLEEETKNIPLLGLPWFTELIVIFDFLFHLIEKYLI